MSAYLPVIVALIGTALGAVPVWWLEHLRGKHRQVDPAYWWIAGALAVSFLADSLAQILPARAANDAYPLLQSGLIGLVLIEQRKQAIRYCFLLAGAALLVPLAGMRGPDVLFSSVAWLSVAWIAYRYQSLPARLRLSLLVLFGLSWAAWMLYCGGRALWWDSTARVWSGPAWAFAGLYGIYQLTRLVGTALFMWAAAKPTPRLKVYA